MNSLLALFLLSGISPSSAATPGLRNEQTVLKGVLVRAGGPGGMHSLPDQTVQELCEEGFQTVYYLYPESNFSNPGPHQCERGTLTYKGGSFLPSGVRPILADVAKAARGTSGPVLVHCWNGSHGAGEVAAYALMQFCGWSGHRASEYWARTIHDPENLPQYAHVLTRIQSFHPFPGLDLVPDARESICP